MRIKPAPGLSVRNPADKQLLPADGIDVPDGDILWTKLLNDGDVVLVPTTQAEAAKEGNHA